MSYFDAQTMGLAPFIKKCSLTSTCEEEQYNLQDVHVATCTVPENYISKHRYVGDNSRLKLIQMYIIFPPIPSLQIQLLWYIMYVCRSIILFSIEVEIKLVFLASQKIENK